MGPYSRQPVQTSRRGFLAAGGAAVLASGLQAGRAGAQANPPAQYVRMNLSDRGGCEEPAELSGRGPRDAQAAADGS